MMTMTKFRAHRLSLLLPATLGLAVIGGLSLAGIGGGGVPAHALRFREAASAGPITYPGAGIVLAPPPAGSSPAVTAAGAVNAYTASGVFPGVGSMASGPADVRLFSFSDNVQGDIQPDGSVKPTYQKVLAWAVVFHGVPYTGVSGAVGGAPVLEDVVAAVDANTGKLLEAFADVPA